MQFSDNPDFFYICHSICPCQKSIFKADWLKQKPISLNPMRFFIVLLFYSYSTPVKS